MIGPLELTDRSRGGIAILSRIRFVERTGSTNSDLIADQLREKAIGSLLLNRMLGADARGVDGCRRSAISMAVHSLSSSRAIPRRKPCLSLRALRSSKRSISAAPDEVLMFKWPNDVLMGSAKLAGILLERNSDRVVIGFGVNLPRLRSLSGGNALRSQDVLNPRPSPPCFNPVLNKCLVFGVEASRCSSLEHGLNERTPWGLVFVSIPAARRFETVRSKVSKLMGRFASGPTMAFWRSFAQATSSCER